MLPPTLRNSLLVGGTGFGLASLAVFTTVAFAERWMYVHFGLWGAYLAWTTLFILLGGGALQLIVAPPWRGLRFLLLFCLAFTLYAAGWIAAYFTLRDGPAEWAGAWVGSLAGSALLATSFAFGFGARRALPRLFAVIFAANSLGYFLGDALDRAIPRPAGMLLWGVAYGICLGAGLGAALYLAQQAGGNEEGASAPTHKGEV
jgi:hypothetical protein